MNNHNAVVREEIRRLVTDIGFNCFMAYGIVFTRMLVTYAIPPSSCMMLLFDSSWYRDSYHLSRADDPFVAKRHSTVQAFVGDVRWATFHVPEETHWVSFHSLYISTSYQAMCTVAGYERNDYLLSYPQCGRYQVQAQLRTRDFRPSLHRHAYVVRRVGGILGIFFFFVAELYVVHCSLYKLS